MRTDIATVREIPDMHNMGHTCASLNGELLLVWGGAKDRVSVNAKNSSIWIYETLTGYWRHRSCSGECPPYVTSSASCLLDQKMYIFGGFSAPKDNWLDCFYHLDLETFIWTNLGAQARAHPTKPIRSDKNVAWSYEGKVYVFGGFGWCQVEHYAELINCQKDLQLAPDDQRNVPIGWNNQLVEYNPKSKTWRWPSYSGSCPSARAAHSGALMGDKYFVFGGRDGFERLNDLHSLDMRTFTWQKIAVISCEPTPVRRALRAPINHLLEDNRVDGQQSGSVAASVRSEDGAEADDSHRQIVEEMHEVGVEEDEEERWNLPTSSQPNISSDDNHIDNDHDDQSKQDTDDQEFEDGDFGYPPNASHLLERWSFSSTSNNDTQANIIACPEPESTQQVSRQLQPASTTTTLDVQNDLHVRSQMLAPDSNNEPLLEASIAVQGQRGRDQSDNWRDIEQQQQLARLDDGLQYEGPALELLPSPAQAADQDQELEAINSGQAIATQAQPSMPVGRSFCSLTPISADQMLLFGGVSSQDEKLNDCWIFNTTQNRWIQVDHMKSNHKLIRPRLWHTGARTKQNEVVILGGSASDDLNEYCTDVLLISFQPRTLKRLALDTVSRAVRMKTIQRTKGIPSTLMKLIKLRKQAMALTTYRPDNIVR